jgi:hypothetical protein
MGLPRRRTRPVWSSAIIGLNAIALYDDVGSILDQVAKFHAPNEAEDDCTFIEIRYFEKAT